MYIVYNPKGFKFITEPTIEDAKATADRVGGEVFVPLSELEALKRKLKTTQQQLAAHNRQAVRDLRYSQDYLPYEEDDRR